ncbi:MAG: MFS transporter [Cyclobacteriaceae bacterium]|nr:MFS transporter [Cyclobacteriaceae bacterium]
MSREKFLLLILAGALFTHIMDFMIMMPLGPQLMRTFDISAGEFSFLVSTYSFSAFFSGLLSSLVIDRYDRKISFSIVYVGFLIGTLGCSLADTYELLIIARSFTGFFGGVVGALVLSIVSDMIPLERRAEAIGFVMAAFSVASVFGVPFGLFISARFSWQAPFVFLLAFSLVISLLVFIFLPKLTSHLSTDKNVHPLEGIKRVLGRKNPLYGLVFTAVLMLGHFTIIPFIAPYMVGNVGFTEAQLAYIYLFGGGFTIVTSQIIGKLADKFGRLNIFTLFGILVLIPVILITNLPEVPLWVALIITSMFFVFANGRMVPSTTMVTSIIRPENRGTFMSLRASVQQLFSGIAALIGGLLVTEIPSTINPEVIAIDNYWHAGIFSIIFSVFTLFVARKLKVAAGA